MPTHQYKTMTLIDFDNAKRILTYRKHKNNEIVTKIGQITDLNEKLAVPDNVVNDLFDRLKDGYFIDEAYYDETDEGAAHAIDPDHYVSVNELQNQILKAHPEWFFTTTGNFRKADYYWLKPRLVSYLVQTLASQYLNQHSQITLTILIEQFNNHYPYLKLIDYDAINYMANLIRNHTAMRINKTTWGPITTANYAAKLNEKLNDLKPLAAKDPQIAKQFNAFQTKLTQIAKLI